QELHRGDPEAAESPSDSAQDGGGLRGAEPPEELAHSQPSGREVESLRDRQRPGDRKEEEQPRERVEELVLRIPGEALPLGEERVPGERLPAPPEAPDHRLQRVVVGEHVAVAEDPRAEKDSSQKKEQARRENQVRRKRLAAVPSRADRGSRRSRIGRREHQRAGRADSRAGRAAAIRTTRKAAICRTTPSWKGDRSQEKSTRCRPGATATARSL